VNGYSDVPDKATILKVDGDKRVSEHPTHLVSLAKANSALFQPSLFTTCAVSSLLRQVD